MVSVLFVLPVFTSGMEGFITTITNGELTPDKFHVNIFGIDFAKNLTISLQCFLGTKMDVEAQKLLAQSFVAMCVMCLGVSMGPWAMAPIQEVVPALIYLTVVPGAYIAAIMGAGKGKSS